jgi:glutamine amidotransferase
MGWNQLRIMAGGRLFQGISGEPFMYFAHSYYVPADDVAGGAAKVPPVAALANYGLPFAAAVERNNVFGVQFHPEKSGETGLRVLENFARICSLDVLPRSLRGGQRAG